jgi:hypothetical protein
VSPHSLSDITLLPDQPTNTHTTEMKKIITLTLAYGVLLAVSSCTSRKHSPQQSMPGMSAQAHANMKM